MQSGADVIEARKEHFQLGSQQREYVWGPLPLSSLEALPDSLSAALTGA